MWISREKRSGPMFGRQLGVQHLDGHVPVVLEIGGEVDRGHAAATQFALDGVAFLERGLQAGESVGHGRGQR